MAIMHPPAPNPHFLPFRHDRWLDSARALADRPSAIEAGISFDDAYAAIAQVDVHYGSTPLTEATGLSSRVFYNLAEGLDVLLDHGNPDQKQNAAVFAAELATVADKSTEAETKRSILANVLGVVVPSDIPASQQIAEKRLLTDGTRDEQLVLAGLIQTRQRIISDHQL